MDFNTVCIILSGLCLICRDVLCTIGRSRSQVSIFRYLPIAGGAQIFYTSLLRVWHEYKLEVSIRGLAFCIKLIVKFFKIPFVNTTFRCTPFIIYVIWDSARFKAECDSKSHLDDLKTHNRMTKFKFRRANLKPKQKPWRAKKKKANTILFKKYSPILHLKQLFKNTQTSILTV